MSDSKERDLPSASRLVNGRAKMGAWLPTGQCAQALQTLAATQATQKHRDSRSSALKGRPGDYQPLTEETTEPQTLTLLCPRLKIVNGGAKTQAEGSSP